MEYRTQNLVGIILENGAFDRLRFHRQNRPTTTRKAKDSFQLSQLDDGFKRCVGQHLLSVSDKHTLL